MEDKRKEIKDFFEKIAYEETTNETNKFCDETVFSTKYNDYGKHLYFHDDYKGLFIKWGKHGIDLDKEELEAICKYCKDIWGIGK